MTNKLWRELTDLTAEKLTGGTPSTGGLLPPGLGTQKPNGDPVPGGRPFEYSPFELDRAPWANASWYFGP